MSDLHLIWFSTSLFLDFKEESVTEQTRFRGDGAHIFRHNTDMANANIEHVSDTAIWVAYYRALETERSDALFRDPLAQKLVGSRGEAIARSLKQTSRYTQQNVVVRTYIIDRFLQTLVSRGFDTVINLGAGLDTRPYRMDLPASLKWIEVDYPHVIQLKNDVLANEKPRVALERVALDLSDETKRRELFNRLASSTRRAVILTEGVLPYLSVEAVHSFANDLHAHPSFEAWICDYMSPDVYRYINNPKRLKQMRNAPFLFFPPDPIGFFKDHGWTVEDLQYIQKTTVELKRPSPMPWYAHLMIPLMPKEMRERMQKMSGYMILKRT